MKSPYKWAVGGLVGLGLLATMSTDLNYDENRKGQELYEDSSIVDLKPLETKDSIKEGMLEEMRKFDEIEDEDSRNMVKGMLLDHYLQEMERRIVGNLLGRYTKFEVVDYIDALVEIITGDDDLPDEYALLLEKSKEKFLRGEELLKKATEKENKKDKVII